MFEVDVKKNYRGTGAGGGGAGPARVWDSDLPGLRNLVAECANYLITSTIT